MEDAGLPPGSLSEYRRLKKLKPEMLWNGLNANQRAEFDAWRKFSFDRERANDPHGPDFCTCYSSLE